MYEIQEEELKRLEKVFKERSEKQLVTYKNIINTLKQIKPIVIKFGKKRVDKRFADALQNAFANTKISVWLERSAYYAYIRVYDAYSSSNDTKTTVLVHVTEDKKIDAELTLTEILNNIKWFEKEITLLQRNQKQFHKAYDDASKINKMIDAYQAKYHLSLRTYFYIQRTT